MKIRILLHKPKRWDILGQLIRFWTWLVSPWKNGSVGPYDHAEVWTPNTIVPVKPESLQFGVTMDRFYPAGTCWTSTLKDKARGTVKRPASDVIHNPKRWDYIELEVTDEEYNILVVWMNGEVLLNAGYSFRDIGKFFGLGFLADKLRNICSEFVNNALWQADVVDKFGVVSPRRLAYLLNAKGYATRPLR